MSRAQLQIERLSKSGDGVAQLDGRTVFVSGALPGEQVLAEVLESGRVLRGALIEVQLPSPARRPAACPLADRCGGCDWLHVDEAVQRAQKEEIVVSALEHLGGIGRDRYRLLPTVGSERALGYRRRAVFHRAGQGLGFFGRHSHQRVEVGFCPALTEPLEALPAKLASVLALVLRDLEEVRVLESEGAVAVSLHLAAGVRERHQRAGAALIEAAGVQGVVLVPKKGASELLGAPVLGERAGTRLRPDAFAQANAQVNEALVAAAAEATGPGALLELYSGNGNFTLAVAARAASVLAVESDAVSLELAREAVRKKGVQNVRFVLGDAAKVTRGLIEEGQRFSGLLVDPPRGGAVGLADWAAALGVARVVYVACDPGALARDAGELSRRGFWPASLRLFDLFPQTRHVEALMVFETRG